MYEAERMVGSPLERWAEYFALPPEGGAAAVVESIVMLADGLLRWCGAVAV